MASLWISVQRSLPAFLWSMNDSGRSKEYWSSLQDIMFVSHAVVAYLSRDSVTLKMLTLAHPLAEGVLFPFLCLSGAHPTGIRSLPWSHSGKGSLLPSHNEDKASVASRADLVGSHCSALETFTAPSVHFSLRNFTSGWGLEIIILYTLYNVLYTMIEGMKKVWITKQLLCTLPFPMPNTFIKVKTVPLILYNHHV